MRAADAARRLARRSRLPWQRVPRRSRHARARARARRSRCCRGGRSAAATRWCSASSSSRPISSRSILAGAPAKPRGRRARVRAGPVLPRVRAEQRARRAARSGDRGGGAARGRLGVRRGRERRAARQERRARRGRRDHGERPARRGRAAGTRHERASACRATRCCSRRSPCRSSCPGGAPIGALVATRDGGLGARSRREGGDRRPRSCSTCATAVRGSSSRRSTRRMRARSTPSVTRSQPRCHAVARGVRYATQGAAAHHGGRRRSSVGSS